MTLLSGGSRGIHRCFCYCLMYSFSPASKSLFSIFRDRKNCPSGPFATYLLSIQSQERLHLEASSAHTDPGCSPSRDPGSSKPCLQWSRVGTFWGAIIILSHISTWKCFFLIKFIGSIKLCTSIKVETKMLKLLNSGTVGIYKSCVLSK